MSDIHSEYVELSVADGSTMRAWLAHPPANQMRAGLMLFQEAFGVNSHIRSVADRLAREGYLAIAPEIYHRFAPGFEGDYKDAATAMTYARLLAPEELEQDIRATHAVLQQQAVDKIVSVGYCMGGRVSFLANVTVPVKAAVSYYGGGLQNILDRAPQASAPMLFFWGEQDQHITGEIRQQVAQGMTQSPHPSVQVTFSDAGHGFFCDQRGSYNPGAAQLSWELMLAFFRQHLAAECRGPSRHCPYAIDSIQNLEAGIL